MDCHNIAVIDTIDNKKKSNQKNGIQANNKDMNHKVFKLRLSFKVD